MKPKSTFSSAKPASIKSISLVLLAFSSLVFYACTTNAQDNIVKKPETDSTNIGTAGTSNKSNDEKEFSFYQHNNGKDNYWKVIFRDGKIAELYKNKQKIPDENIEDYTDMINDELDGLAPDRHEFRGGTFNFGPGPGDIHIEVPQWDRNFDDADSNDSESFLYGNQFPGNMHNFNNEMKKLGKMKFHFHFDTAAFNKSMRKFKKNMENLKIYFKDFDCDMGGFNEGMKNFNEEMKHNRIFDEDFHIDMKDFDHNMEKFSEHMKDFKVNMKGFKESMKKYKEFIKDMRHELVNDGLIKSEDDQFNMKFNAKELLINSKKVPDNLLNKYKKIFKKHFGKDIDDEYYFDKDIDENFDIDDD
jgi:hypothetical protein